MNFFYKISVNKYYIFQRILLTVLAFVCVLLKYTYKQAKIVMHCNVYRIQRIYIKCNYIIVRHGNVCNRCVHRISFAIILHFILVMCI